MRYKLTVATIIPLGVFLVAAAPLLKPQPGKPRQAIRHRVDTYLACSEFSEKRGPKVPIALTDLLGWRGAVYEDLPGVFTWEWRTVTNEGGKRLLVTSICSVVRTNTGLLVKPDSSGEWGVLQWVSAPVACEAQQGLCD